MQEKQDIHAYDRRLARCEKTLAKISPANAGLILRYKDHLFARGLGKPRVLKYIEVLKLLATMIETPSAFSTRDLDKLTKADMYTLVSILQQKPYSPWTKQTYKVILRRFICWVKNCEDGIIPDEVRWIKISMNHADCKLPGEGDLITKEEMTKAIDACDLLRDKTFLTVLYESGCRIGEQVQKNKIPSYYIQKYDLTNLWRIDLSDYWRLIYTIQSDEAEIIDFVLNIVDHKKYDKIFGYKGK